MNMRIVLPVVAVCVLASAAAPAQRRTLEQVESSYELVLTQIELPSNTSGTVIFKECDTCDTVALRVTSATQYFLNGAAISLADLRATAETVQGERAANIGVYVHYSLATDDVTRVRVTRFGL